MKLSIVIPTIKPTMILHRQLLKIINSKMSNFEVILIHQGIKGLLKIKNKKIKYYRLHKKKLSLAKNYGIKKSSSDIITILDDDIINNVNYFKYGLNHMLLNKEISLLFGNIINKNKKKFSINIPKTNTKINYFNFLGCLASSMWIRKNNYKSKKIFDENFGIGSFFGSGEESDVVIRSLLQNKKIYFFNKYPLIHDDNQNLNCKKTFKKFFSYGLGNGALYRKNIVNFNYKFFFLFFLNILKSILGIFYGILRVDNYKIFIKYFSLFLGRLIGYFKYRTR